MIGEILHQILFDYGHNMDGNIELILTFLTIGQEKSIQ